MIQFFIVFIAGLLLGWVITEFRRLFPRLRESVQASTSARQRVHDVTYETGWRERIRLHVQSLHVASPLFALDEVAIPPRVLASSPYTPPGNQGGAEDLSSNIIPILYDFPELGSIYNTPSLSIPEALAGGADIALVGEPGCGKTFALSYLASSVCRQAAETERLNPCGRTQPAASPRAGYSDSIFLQDNRAAIRQDAKRQDRFYYQQIRRRPSSAGDRWPG
jgi:hypothetical protein